MDNNITETEMKVGHPPANKVGGRRVVNRKDRKNSDSNDNANSEGSDEVVREIIDYDLPAKVRYYNYFIDILKYCFSRWKDHIQLKL